MVKKDGICQFRYAIHFVCPLRFDISIVLNFSWDDCNNKKKLETMLMQNVGGKQNVSWGMRLHRAIFLQQLLPGLQLEHVKRPWSADWGLPSCLVYYHMEGLCCGLAPLSLRARSVGELSGIAWGPEVSAWYWLSSSSLPDNTTFRNSGNSWNGRYASP